MLKIQCFRLPKKKGCQYHPLCLPRGQMDKENKNVSIKITRAEIADNFGVSWFTKCDNERWKKRQSGVRNRPNPMIKPACERFLSKQEE